GSVGKHALAVQLRELVQVRYPRRLVIRGRRRRRGRGGWSDGRGWLDGYGSTGAGRSRELLARGVHPELTPEPLGLRHVLSLGEPARAERRGRAGHRTYVTQLGVADLKAPAAHRTDQVVVRPVRHDGHEVQAHRLLRPYVMEKHLVVTVRAHARRDLALVFRTAGPKTEDHHHAAIEAEAPGAAVHPWQVRTGAGSGHWSAGAMPSPAVAPSSRSASTVWASRMSGDAFATNVPPGPGRTSMTPRAGSTRSASLS